MKHRGSFPHKIHAPDRHNGQRDKRTNGRTYKGTRLFVRPFVSYMEFDTKLLHASTRSINE